MAVVSASVLSSWVRVLLDAVAASGRDSAPLLQAAGFTRDEFLDPNARQPIAAVARLWHLAAKRSDDPAFALRVPEYVRHTSFHALGYAVFASATLAEALERVVGCCRVVTDSGMLRLDHADDDVLLRIIPSLPHHRAAEAFRDSMTALIFRMLRVLLPDHFALRRVTLHRTLGTDVAVHAAFFGCEVERGVHDVLHFDPALLSLPLPGSHPELARHNDIAVREYLARIDSGTIVDRARATILEQATRDISPELVARKLGMSLRTLQRSLRAQASSYEQLLREVRRELACKYLEGNRYSVTEIAVVLGYDSQSAFARAFKRWTGLPPTEYQQSSVRSARSARSSLAK
jgi:AraC-like DNA-binding protein